MHPCINISMLYYIYLLLFFLLLLLLYIYIYLFIISYKYVFAIINVLLYIIVYVYSNIVYTDYAYILYIILMYIYIHGHTLPLFWFGHKISWNQRYTSFNLWSLKCVQNIHKVDSTMCAVIICDDSSQGLMTHRDLWQLQNERIWSKSLWNIPPCRRQHLILLWRLLPVSAKSVLNSEVS